MSPRNILFFAFIFILKFSFGQNESINIHVDHYKTKTFDVAIFPANSLDLIPGKRFTPTRQEIDSAEYSLKTELKKLNVAFINQTSSPIIHKKLNKYKRQYFGYYNLEGEKILLINCIWLRDEEYNKNWLSNMIIVLDGGSYYWHVYFNLRKGLLFDLSINGYAYKNEIKNKRHLTCLQPQQN